MELIRTKWARERGNAVEVIIERGALVGIGHNPTVWMEIQEDVKAVGNKKDQDRLSSRPDILLDVPCPKISDPSSKT